MPHIIVGLGNPGEEYTNTRHNTGRFFLEAFAKANDFSEWELDKKLKALVSKGFVSASNVKGQLLLVLPESFMNNSGESLKKIKDLLNLNIFSIYQTDLKIFEFEYFGITFNKFQGNPGVQT